MAKPKLGSGQRFASGVNKIMSKEGLSKGAASAIMANAGRKAHGAKAMAKYSAEGRKGEHPMVAEGRKAGLNLSTKK